MRKRAWGVAVAVTAGLLGVSVASADTVTLTSGDVLIGTVVSQDEAGVTLAHPVFGELPIPGEQVAAVVVGDAEAEAAVVAAVAEATAPEPTPVEAAVADAPVVPVDPEPERGSLFGLDDFLPGWNKRIEFGSSGQFGTTETFDLVARATADFENDIRRWMFETSFFYGTSDGEVDENELQVDLRRDWLFPDERYFFFAQGGYELDEFEDFDHRITGGGGIGYMFIKREKLSLEGLAGLNAITELGGDQDDDVGLEALVGIELAYDIAEDHAMTFSNFVFPRLDDAGEYRNVSKLEYILSLNVEKGMALRFGLENEYDSEQEDDPNEFRYFVTLVLDL